MRKVILGVTGWELTGRRAEQVNVGGAGVAMPRRSDGGTVSALRDGMTEVVEGKAILTHNHHFGQTRPGEGIYYSDTQHLDTFE